MNESDNEARIEVLVLLAESYRKEFSKGALRMMMGALDDIAPAELEQVAKEWLRTKRWMPTVAELRVMVTGYDPDDENSRLKTIMKVQRQLRAKGWYDESSPVKKDHLKEVLKEMRLPADSFNISEV